MASEQFGLPPAAEGRWELRGPAENIPIVQAWADDYIRYGERRPAWKRQVREAIRTSCRRLEPPARHVLHATFFGDKPSDADIENLALYNIDESFTVAGRNGIRFEHGDPVVPKAPGGAQYPFCYRYEVVPRGSTFRHWQTARAVASFGWTDLGAFVDEKRVAQVWLALSRASVEVSEPLAPETPFAVRVEVRPPHGRPPVWGGSMKKIFDGVISAFQADIQRPDLPEIVARLANYLPAVPDEIEEHLLDERQAVLGVVTRLVYLRGAGVQWNPSDHLCVAGELLAAEPAGPSWVIKGEIVELSR